MHTVWKGAISFGLVHVPVKMFSATEDKDVSLRYIHKECGSPLSYVRKCPVCDREVAWEEIGKGYEYEKGKFVIFDKDELDALTEESTKTIAILDFVDLKEIDPIYFQKTYYLSPDQAGAGAYGLLMEAMRQTGKIGVAKISIRSKSSLAAIRVLDNCLSIETMFYPDEIRPVTQVPGLPEAAAVSDKELDMAKLLISQLSTPFEPGKYTDDYRQRMLDLIAGKVAGEEIRVAPARAEANVIDLMAALQASIEAVQHIPSDPGTPAGVEAKPRRTGSGRKKAAKPASKVGASAGAGPAAVGAGIAAAGTAGAGRGLAAGAGTAAAGGGLAAGAGAAAAGEGPAAGAGAAAASSEGPAPVIAPKPKRRSSKSKMTIS
ncbi:Ku protein [Paenibacillus sp. HN-1]|uniref:non-homologous end joining protein Ku n=1 Tax=Paenibacillus TaxID=44249 RepID=UPI001CA7C3DB|nr:MULTISPECIES: Ku protein [Paenibacillus]MBY9081267.1 Ku protein [Paenibacillus sp. CGMCC 1.18879]MBY9087540.1 Ku protein [Paenibacillus sinensis]